MLKTNMFVNFHYLSDIKELEFIDTEIAASNFMAIRCNTLTLNHCLAYVSRTFVNAFPAQGGRFQWTGTNHLANGIRYNLKTNNCKYAPFGNRNRGPRFEVLLFYHLPDPYYSTIEAQYDSDTRTNWGLEESLEDILMMNEVFE